MRRGGEILVAVLFAGAWAIAPARAAELPPVFQQLSFARAKERAEAESRLLVVKATAKWCGPCRLMDRTTWRDGNVVASVRENAIAIQLDVEL